jgi:hypothetical protein
MHRADARCHQLLERQYEDINLMSVRQKHLRIRTWRRHRWPHDALAFRRQGSTLFIDLALASFRQVQPEPRKITREGAAVGHHV